MFTTSSKLMKDAGYGKLRYSDFMKNTDYGSTTNANSEDSDHRVERSFMTDAHRVNAWVRAIVDRTVDRFDQVEMFPLPMVIKKDAKPGDYDDDVKKKMELLNSFLMKPNYDNESFSSIKRKVATDVLIYDEAGIQIVPGETIVKNKIPYELYSNISGEELYVNANINGTLRDKKTYVQIRNGREIASWDKYEFMNFIKNRRAGYVNGLSPIESCAESIIGDLEAMNYNVSFFSNNARPNIAFLFNELGFGPGQTALERAKKWYYQEHKGKPHLPLFMGTQKGKIDIKELTVSNSDMQFSDWQLMLLSRIMSVYGMQPQVLGILTDTTGKLNSEVQSETYKKNAIIPLVNMFVNTFNSVFVWGDDNLNMDDIYLTSSNLDIDDDKKQTEIWQIFLETGVITINQVRNELQMPPVSWGNEPFVPLNFSPLSILTEWQKSRIEANLKNAENKGDGGSNYKTGTKPEKDDKKPAAKPAAKPASKFMTENFEIPTGLEHIEPSIIMEVVTKMINKRETFLDKPIVPLNMKIDTVVGRFGLKWNNIMEKR